MVWGVAMGLFRMARQDAKDLWGFSCSSNADAIQAEVNAFLDFGKLCTTQVRPHVHVLGILANRR